MFGVKSCMMCMDNGVQKDCEDFGGCVWKDSKCMMAGKVVKETQKECLVRMKEKIGKVCTKQEECKCGTKCHDMFGRKSCMMCMDMGVKADCDDLGGCVWKDDKCFVGKDDKKTPPPTPKTTSKPDDGKRKEGETPKQCMERLKIDIGKTCKADTDCKCDTKCKVLFGEVKGCMMCMDNGNQKDCEGFGGCVFKEGKCMMAGKDGDDSKRKEGETPKQCMTRTKAPIAAKCTKTEDCKCDALCVDFFGKACTVCEDNGVEKDCTEFGGGKRCEWKDKKCMSKMGGGEPEPECMKMKSKETCVKGCMWKKKKCTPLVCNPTLNPKKCAKTTGCRYYKDDKKCAKDDGKAPVDNKACKKGKKSEEACTKITGCVYNESKTRKGKVKKSCLPK